MKDVLRQLVQLQDLMRGAEEQAEKIAAVPAQVARLEKDLLVVQEEVERERAGLEELQKDRRRLESDLMGVESKIQKFQSQLQDVKTNKEYQAVLTEIEGCRQERVGLDEKILTEMEEGEERNEKFRGVEARLKAKRSETEEGKRRLHEQAGAMKTEKERLEAERQRLVVSIPASHLDPFMKIARSRNGLALVPVREELCGGCHVRVMPTLIQQARRATRLIACDSCGRFMYVPDDDPAPAAASIPEPPVS